MRRQRSKQEHFFTGLKREQLPALLAMAAPKDYALAARNLTGNQNLDGAERSARAARIHDLTRDHTQPQMELAL